MSDEVKQAAERLRTIDDMQRDKCFPSPILQIADWQELAKAYLREHANDPENALPLTAEILQASGWEPPVYYGWWLQGCGFGLSPATRTVDSRKVFGMVSGQTGDVLGHLETVGDLRKLLEALHVDAVITVPNGGE